MRTFSLPRGFLKAYRFANGLQYCLIPRNYIFMQTTELPKLLLPESAGGRLQSSPAQRLLGGQWPFLRSKQVVVAVMLAAATFAAVTTTRRVEEAPLPLPALQT